VFASIRAALFMRAIDGFEMRSIFDHCADADRGDSFRHLCYARQLPLPKSGGCPPGFRESGGYCVAGEDRDTEDRPLPRRLDNEWRLLHAARRATMTGMSG
jgi:hypothetical protein